jgi:hypothetical protein
MRLFAQLSESEDTVITVGVPLDTVPLPVNEQSAVLSL